MSDKQTFYGHVWRVFKNIFSDFSLETFSFTPRRSMFCFCLNFTQRRKTFSMTRLLFTVDNTKSSYLPSLKSRDFWPKWFLCKNSFICRNKCECQIYTFAFGIQQKNGLKFNFNELHCKWNTGVSSAIMLSC